MTNDLTPKTDVIKGEEHNKLTPLDTPYSHQSLIERAAELHPIATMLQHTFPVQPDEYEAQHPVRPPKKPSTLKKILRPIGSIFLLFLLMFVAAIFFVVVGEDSIATINTYIQKYWSLATVIRLFVYIGISWFVLPRMLNTIKHRKMLELHYYYEKAKQNPLCDMQTLWEIEERLDKVARSNLSPWFFLIGLIGFDLIAVQLPFLLK